MNEKLKNYLNEIKNKKILIQGLGINGGGLGSALFFLENGFDITITDLKKSEELKNSIKKLIPYKNKINYVLGEHREKDFINADIIVKGPGIPYTNKFIKIALNSGVNITSDLEIFFKITPCKIFGVTGSKGKSTTVSVIYNIFLQETNNSFMGGNITISPLTFYKKLNKDSLVILELSSWQLRDLKGKNFHFKGTAITNLLQDHLNYYLSMNDYLNDKIIITDNQNNDDFCILPYKDKFLKLNKINSNCKIYTYSKSDTNSTLFYKNGWACFIHNGNIIKIFHLDDLKTQGEHIKLNVLLASGFAYLTGIKKENIINGIKSFKGIPYRMELVRIWNGIKFINDSTATIPDAAYNAILSFKEPIIWIAGGNDKNLDFKIIKKISAIPKKIFLLKGNGTEKMKTYIDRNDIIESDSLKSIVKEALKYTNSGDVVLLSPGCTSFGLFKNEFHRGDIFNKIVRSL